MTMPYEADYENPQMVEEPAEWGDMEPIPVKVHAGMGERVAPEFTSWMTFPIPAISNGTPLRICPHKYHRYKAKFVVNFGGAATLYFANSPDKLSSGNAVTTSFSYTVTAGAVVTLPDYDGQQPIFAIFSGTGPVSIAVMDESYGNVQ